MLHRGCATEEREDLAAVWSAARAAAGDPGVADDVTVAIMVRARLWRRRGTPIARGDLVASAVREVVALSPAPPLDRLDQAERETIALARCGRLGVDAIASALAVDASVVRERMRAGLHVIAEPTLTPRHSARATLHAAAWRPRNVSPA